MLALRDKGAKWGTQIGSRQWPIPHSATEGGSLNIVKLFLERGADVFAMDDSGRTALDVALAPA